MDRSMNDGKKERKRERERQREREKREKRDWSRLIWNVNAEEEKKDPGSHSMEGRSVHNRRLALV